MKKQNKKMNIPVILLGMYGIFVLVRFLLALLTSAYPIVNIDEFLYYGMARSIANGEGLMFRGQQADYSYILYSLVLTPVYLLGLRGPVLYRVTQLWNILLITLAIFPIYGIAKKCVGDERKALWLTGISLLLPDFQLGQLMMTENVIIPLFFTVFYLILCYMESEDLWKILLIGLAGGLLFSAKPGSVIPAAVFFILLLGLSIAKRNMKQIPRIAAGAAVMTAVAGFFFLLVKLFNGNSSILSIYKSQVAEFTHLDVFFRFIGVYILYFFIACGFGCIFLLGKKFKYFQFDRKFELGVILVSLAAAIIGVSWSVNRYEYNANIAHLRYIWMYIPLLLIFSMIPVQNAKTTTKKLRVYIAVIVGLFTVLLIVVGIYAGINQYSVFSENMSLSVMAQLFRDKVPSFFTAAVVWILCLIFAWMAWRKDIRTTERYAVIVLLLGILINNIATYKVIQNDTRFDLAANADELLDSVPDSSSLVYIYTNERNTYFYGPIDFYSPKEISFVSLDNVFNYLYSSQGVFVPFIPDKQRGNIPVREIPDTDTIILDPTVYRMVKLSDNTEHLTFNEDGLHLVKILDKNERWLDWVIGNTKEMTLEAGETGILLIFNEDLLQSPLTFRFKAKTENDTVFSMYSGLEVKSVQLEAGLHEYEVTFQSPQNAYNFAADTGDLRFFDCELINK